MAHILLIEDENLMAKLISQLLSGDGHHVQCEADGEAGVKAAVGGNFDLVITDMSLPKMTGWQVTEKLRADAKTKELPIIGLTAHSTAEDREAAFAAGISAYEAKPLDLQRLKSKINELLQH